MLFNEHDILLFRELCSADEISFEILYNRYINSIYKICYFITRDHSLAKEASMDAFLALWNQRREVAKMERPQAWLYQTARNLSLNTIRKNSSYRRHLNEINHLMELKIDPEQNSQLDETLFQKKLELAISKLPRKQQEAIRLKREGHSRAEIARICNSSEATIKNQLTAAYKKLRDIMKSREV